MKVIKRSDKDIPLEEAHGGSGSRKVYVSPAHLQSKHFEMMTRGYLPGGQTFDWHNHEGVEEIMVVVTGNGEVHDEDGKYSYEPGDVFVFPNSVRHKIHNPSQHQHEMIFVRIKA